MENFRSSWNAVREVAVSYYHQALTTKVSLVSVLMFCAAFVMFNIAANLLPSRRGTSMDGRKEARKKLLADAYGDALLELYANNQLSSAEYRYELKRCGMELGLPDLLPRTKSGHLAAWVTNTIKERIKSRLPKEVLAEHRARQAQRKDNVVQLQTKPKTTTGKLKIPLAL